MHSNIGGGYDNYNSVHRIQITNADDSGTENYLDGSTLEGHEPTQIMHVQPHGFAAVPPSGSHGIVVRLGDHDDNMLVLGGEHADHKPKSLGAGNSAFYNAAGSIMKMIGKAVSLVHAGDYTHKAKTATITVDTFKVVCGGVTLQIDKNGVTITGGSITHDSHAIDKTHKHVNSGGAGLSGIPQ